MRTFLLNFLVENYQIILICLAFIFLLLKMTVHWQEKILIHEIDQLLTPIAHDVLLEKKLPTPNQGQQHLEAVKKTLRGIDLNATTKQTEMQKNIHHQKNIQNNIHASSVPTKQKDAFNAEIDTLISDMEKRAQLRKK